MAKNPFTEHPHSAGETYTEHMRVALGFSRQLFGASLAALTHALLPMLHKTTASDRIRCLHRFIETDERDAITILKAARLTDDDDPPPSGNDTEPSTADPSVLHAS